MNRAHKKSTKRISEEGDFDRVKLGARLRDVRRYINLSQEVVARHVGIPRTALSQIECGRRKIDALELKKIADLYKHPVSYFTDEMPTELGTSKESARFERAVAKLSEHDRAELNRFVEYLHARAQKIRSEED